MAASHALRDARKAVVSTEAVVSRGRWLLAPLSPSSLSPSLPLSISFSLWVFLWS